ncbi:HTTM domain-containing protein [Neomegalonema perideroedes]|uniref:HTTM domain-containing protein n=1 Tax=Neomegalonema perideroedes TaxID=217219 RepID=UPI0003760232|nr:HTTM domain-containing protein [Neomegalonema perideroedes]
MRTPILKDRLSAFRLRLSQPVSALSLAVFRICFGALIFWDVLRFIHYDRVWRYWVAPEFHFSYPGFSWVSAPPEPWIQILWGVLGLAALMVALGLFYRLAVIVLTLLFAWFFLIDAAEYLNHFYLVLLYGFLLCFLPAARVWSLDALIRRRRGRPEPEAVPYAAVFLLRAQTEIMLIFAGLVKLTPDWLAGEPLGIWMRERTAGLWLEPLARQDWLIVAACWAVIALHVLGAPLLLWRRTRLTVFLIYGVFHIGNAWAFNIGIFPWLTIAATTIFFAPDWPARFLRRPLAATPEAAPRKPVSSLALAAMACWIALQLALPLRGTFFDSEVRWSGDGHRFSWRMRIYDRQAEGRFLVKDRATGQEWIVDPVAFLTPRQADKMLVRSDLVRQFAAHLAEVWRAAGYEVSVRAEICKSLNGRPCQDFIDPQVDLTQVRSNPFGADPWVKPLEIPVWGAARAREAERPERPAP